MIYDTHKVLTSAKVLGSACACIEQQLHFSMAATNFVHSWNFC
jgi:hypothetical protein